MHQALDITLPRNPLSHRASLPRSPLRIPVHIVLLLGLAQVSSSGMGPWVPVGRRAEQ